MATDIWTSTPQTVGWIVQVAYVIVIICIIIELFKLIAGPNAGQAIQGKSFADIGPAFKRAFIGEKGMQREEQMERGAENQLQQLERLEQNLLNSEDIASRNAFVRLKALHAELQELYNSVVETERLERQR